MADEIFPLVIEKPCFQSTQLGVGTAEEGELETLKWGLLGPFQSLYQYIWYLPFKLKLLMSAYGTFLSNSSY